MESYDEVAQMLEEIIDEVPTELFTGLSGGVILDENYKLHPNSLPYKPLYIMGEYHNDVTGRKIVIYCGSFLRVHGGMSNDLFREKLRHTFAHELRHHIELLSGVKSLKKFDEERMNMYISGMDIAEFHEPPIE